MPFGPSDLLWIGVVPAAAAALALWVCLRLRVRPTAAWSVSVACGFVLGMIGQNARAGWSVALEKLLHPRAASDWLPWLVLVGAGISALAAYAPRVWQRWLVTLACVFAIAAPMRLLASNALAMSRWSLGEKLGVLTFWSIAFAALWLTLALGRRNAQPRLRSALLLVVALGISITLAASGSFTQGELGGIATATLFGTIATTYALGATGSASALLAGADGPSQAAGPITAMLLGPILLGHYFSELSATNAALLAISIAAAAGWLPVHLPLPLGEGRGEGGERRSKAVLRGVLRVAFALVPLTIAVISAVLAATADPYG